MDIARLRTEFLKTPVVCLLILIAIHLLPKGNRADPAAYGNPFLLALTVIYFAAFLTLLYQLTSPRDHYMRAASDWMFEEGGPALKRTVHGFLHALSAALHPLVWLLMAFVASSAVGVFQSWSLLSAFAAMDRAANVVWVLALIGLAGYPFFGSFLILEAFARWRACREQIRLDEFKPRSLQDLAKVAAARATVESAGDYAFHAGGFDWSWSDFFPSCIVFGQPGSGKTACVLNALLDGLLLSTANVQEKPSGLILDPKGDYRRKIQRLCERHGRAADLLVLDPLDQAHGIRWNPLDSEDDELELAGRFATVLESVGMRSGQDSFWVDSARKFLRHAIALVRATNPAGEPPSFRAIQELASDLGAIATRTDQLDPADGRADQALAFFANEWTNLAAETRSSIQAHVTNMLDPFLMEPYATVFSGRSTMSIARMVDAGKILYVHMPIADREVMARTVGTFVKLEFQREILKRPDKDRHSFFLCDEFQSFFTTRQGRGDADFFERSRQSRHANIIGTQNLPALLKVAKDDKAVVNNLLGNVAVKIFLRNTDKETNQYASELFGQKLVGMASSGSGGPAGFGGLRQGPGNVSVSTQYDARVRPEEFPALAIPSSQGGGDHAGSIVHLASRAEVGKEKLRWKLYPIAG